MVLAGIHDSFNPKQVQVSSLGYFKSLRLCFSKNSLFSQKNSVLSINSRVGSRACLRSRTHPLRCANLKLDFYLFPNISKSNVFKRQTKLNSKSDSLYLIFYLFIEVIKFKKCILYLYFLFEYIIFILYINFKLYFILLLMSSGIFIFLRNLFWWV